MGQEPCHANPTHRCQRRRMELCTLYLALMNTNTPQRQHDLRETRGASGSLGADELASDRQQVVQRQQQGATQFHHDALRAGVRVVCSRCGSGKHRERWCASSTCRPLPRSRQSAGPGQRRCRHWKRSRHESQGGVRAFLCSAIIKPGVVQGASLTEPFKSA